MTSHARRSAILLGCLLATGCSGAAAPAATPVSSSSIGSASPRAGSTVAVRWTNLPTGHVADYQLGGAYPPAPEVSVLTRDSTDRPGAGRYNICYVNGFQTQPGTHWPAHLLVRTRSGHPIVDPNWPDEHVLDISSGPKRAQILRRHRVTLRHCATAGFDAVEFDNLDSYTRSHHKLRLRHAIAFATVLVRAAHQDGLAAAQKNTPELGRRGRDLGFDFAVAEECHRYDECRAYTKVYGPQVIDIEYTDNLRGSFRRVCADPSRPADTVLRDRELTPVGDRHHVYRHC
jgi:hypothetical protein